VAVPQSQRYWHLGCGDRFPVRRLPLRGVLPGAPGSVPDVRKPRVATGLGARTSLDGELRKGVVGPDELRRAVELPARAQDGS
jgi:hypothetical protein